MAPWPRPLHDFDFETRSARTLINVARLLTGAHVEGVCAATACGRAQIVADRVVAKLCVPPEAITCREQIATRLSQTVAERREDGLLCGNSSKPAKRVGRRVCQQAVKKNVCYSCIQLWYHARLCERTNSRKRSGIWVYVVVAASGRLSKAPPVRAWSRGLLTASADAIDAPPAAWKVPSGRTCRQEQRLRLVAVGPGLNEAVRPSACVCVPVLMHTCMHAQRARAAGPSHPPLHWR